MAFQTPIANPDVYKGSFFPNTIRDPNALPDSLISSAEKQRIVLLSSLLWWELGTNSLITGPGEWLSFRRFTSKLSWSWHTGSHKNSLNLLGEKYLNGSHWPVTYKIQWLDTPPFGHFMRITHVTEAPSTGAPLFKQAEETLFTIKNYLLASTLS